MRSLGETKVRRAAQTRPARNSVDRTKVESTTSPDVAIFASFITSPSPKISLVRSGLVGSSQTVPLCQTLSFHHEVAKRRSWHHSRLTLIPLLARTASMSSGTPRSPDRTLSPSSRLVQKDHLWSRKTAFQIANWTCTVLLRVRFDCASPFRRVLPL